MQTFNFIWSIQKAYVHYLLLLLADLTVHQNFNIVPALQIHTKLIIAIIPLITFSLL